MPTPAQINCAAEICCPPAQAERAARAILAEIGVPEDAVETVAACMREQGVAFAPASLMAEIAKLADHPGRQASDKPSSGGGL